MRSVQVNSVRVVLIDTLSEPLGDLAGSALVTGAHAGLESARLVMRKPPRVAVFNDAGVGKDSAGIVGLELLQTFHIPAAAVDAMTARIGDAVDTLENGVVSHCNELAASLGLTPGKRVREALELLEP